MATDVVSDVFRTIRLARARYFDVQAGAPWIAETPSAAELRAGVLRELDIISFHVLLDGSCWAQLSDVSQPAIRLDVGDAVIVCHGDAHFLSSEPGERASAKSEVRARALDEALPFVLSESSRSTASARFVCGYLGCEAQPQNPFLGALPHVLHVRGSSAAGALICELMKDALAECQQPRAGSDTILARLSELMLLHAIRQHVASLPAESTGWLAALRDSHVSAALHALHTSPAAPWTLDALARHAKLSRSIFCKRFSDVMGVSAMQYLANWRLHLAADLLQRRSASITRIAADVGYESDAAFNRAFKRRVGVPPGAWRRRSRSLPLNGG